MLGECNFFVECLIRNWIFVNVFVSDGVYVVVVGVYEERGVILVGIRVYRIFYNLESLLLCC